MAAKPVRNVEGHLPLKPVHFLVLVVLLEGDCHGYGLVKEIEERTEGGMQLEPGNLYRFIRKLMDVGMIAESSRRPARDADDERRRYYRITPFGREVVTAEAARMKALVRFVERHGPSRRKEVGA
jgi:DNA-binding PadR family transcriptional regulator